MPIAVAGAAGIAFVVLSVLQRAQTAGFNDQGVHLVRVSVHAVSRDLAVSPAVMLPRMARMAITNSPISHSILDGGSLFGLLGLLAFAVVAWRYRREFPLASFGYFGFLLLLAPTSSFVPIRDVAVERRLYLPFICLLLITVDLLRRWKTSRHGDRGDGGCLRCCRPRYAISETRCGICARPSGRTRARSRPTMLGPASNWRMRSGRTASASRRPRTTKRVSKMQKPDDRLLIDWAYALECAGKAG